MKTPVHMWTFESSSGSKTYETLKWSDNSLSCDCPGWTRRCVDGVRTCKHVRSVEAGHGSDNSLFNAPVGAGHVVTDQDGVHVHLQPTATKPVLKQSTFARKFV